MTCWKWSGRTFSFPMQLFTVLIILQRMSVSLVNSVYYGIVRCIYFLTFMNFPLLSRRECIYTEETTTSCSQLINTLMPLIKLFKKLPVRITWFLITYILVQSSNVYSDKII